MITGGYGNGEHSWTTRDVKCKVSRNGSFIQILYEEMGLVKRILIPEKELKQIDSFERHGDSFDTFCEISQPADAETLMEEENTRRAYLVNPPW